jgi:protein TonB
LICAPGESGVPVFSVPNDLGKIATHLPCGEPVIFVEKVAVPAGSDKIRYADGQAGYVADAYLETPIATPGGDVTAPSLVYRPDARYTPEARRAGIEGTVKFWIVIDARGKVSDIQQVSPPLGYGLDNSAMEAVKTWRFNPATHDGAPVPVRVGAEVTFRRSAHAQ